MHVKNEPRAMTEHVPQAANYSQPQSLHTIASFGSIFRTAFKFYVCLIDIDAPVDIFSRSTLVPDHEARMDTILETSERVVMPNMCAAAVPE